MSSQTEDEVIDPCTICHKPKANHPYRHAWVGYGGDRSGLFENPSPASPPPSQNAPKQGASANDASASPGRVGIASTGDPVLRLALIRRGLITVEDLDSIEQELRASGVASNVTPTSLG